MAITSSAALYYESAQDPQDFEAMTDSGDQTTFDASFAPFSGKGGYDVTVRPYGVATGLVITPAISGSNNVIDIAAGTVYAPGMTGADTEGLVTISASTDETVARPTVSDYLITSVTINSSGAFAMVQGTEGSSFSTTRGAAGGPPLIPTTSIEIGWVRYSSQTAAPVASGEIQQVVGQSQERWDFPVWTVGYASGDVTFAQALPTIHTGSVPKAVYVKGYTPIFAPVSRASDFVPADTTSSVTSTQTYDGTVNSRTQSLAQASFTARLTNGITDNILNESGQRIWFKFYQDSNDTAKYILTQGYFDVARTFPVNDFVQISATISAEEASVNFGS